MEIMEANINSLKSFRLDLYKFLDGVQFTGSDVVKEKSSRCSVTINEDMWQKSIKHSEINQCRLLIINGCLPSEGIERIMERYGSCIRQVLFVCKSREKFAWHLKQVDYSKWIQDDRFEFCIGLDEKYISVCLKDYFIANDRLIYREKIGFFNYWPDIEVDGRYYVRFAEMVPEVLLQLQSNLLAPDEDAYRGFLNLNQNLSSQLNVGLVDGLKDAARGRSAILIASGPSLKFHLQHLHKLKKDCIIGCSDSALKSVIDHGLQPHFCFSLERMPGIGRLFAGVPSQIETTLVTLPICHPSVLKNYPGSVLFMMRQSAFSDWLCPDAIMFNVGSSVSTMAIRFFAHLGISHVSLLGQDFAYDPVSNQSHFNGIHQEILDVEGERFNDGAWCDVESNAGIKIKSNVYWKMFLEEMKINLTKFFISCTNVIPEDYGARLDCAVRVDPEVFWRQQESSQNSTAEILPELSVPHRFMNEGQYESLVRDTLVHLSVLRRIVLDYLDTMSWVLLESFPESRNSETVSYYKGKLVEWIEIENRILNHEIYLNLIKMMMIGSHLKYFTIRESIFWDSENFVAEIQNYISVTQEWLKNTLYWIDRVCHVVRQD